MAGISAQIAPAATDVTNMMMMSRTLGTLSPSRIMQAADAKQPMRIWPSPPRFQNFIRNAGVSATEMQSRMASSWRSDQVLRAVPKAPLIMVAYTSMGLRPVVMVVMKPQTTRAMTIAPRRTASDCHSGISLRLVMCIISPYLLRAWSS